MKLHTEILIVLLSLTLVVGLPVSKTKKDDDKKDEKAQATSDMETVLEYERYLKEIVEALESDPEFRKKLDKAPEADIRSGKIAQELEYVNHHVRTKLDEIKRREIERLRSLANREYELSNHIDRDHMKISQHLDHENQHSFEIEDLRKLIKKTSDDLAEADRKRRAEFKEYEMQKEFEREAQKKEMDEEHRKKFEEELKKQEEKHKAHEKVHHPGNKAQLEEVWEKQDHMDKDDFDPHAFFMMHDVDGNGVWDETEVKALFIKELDKVYQSGLPEDDMRERAEEMERMREHVFQETDVNHDGLISFQEFLEQTKRDEFNKDPEWETVDQKAQFSHEEYLEFERRRQEEIQRMIAQGLLPPHPNMPQGYYPNGAHDAYQQQHPQMHYQNPQQQHLQQQQQYMQQQKQYQQQQQYQQQKFQQGQHVNLNQNQIYEHVPNNQGGQLHQAQQNTNNQQQGQYQPQPQHANSHIPQGQAINQQQGQQSSNHQQQMQQMNPNPNSHGGQPEYQQAHQGQQQYNNQQQVQNDQQSPNDQQQQNQPIRQQTVDQSKLQMNQQQQDVPKKT